MRSKAPAMRGPRWTGPWALATTASGSVAVAATWARKRDLRRSIVAIPGAEPDESLVDVVWALLGPEVYLELTVDAGRSRAEYEAVVSEASRRLFGLPAPPTARTRRT